jgi:hypothetical protein
MATGGFDQLSVRTLLLLLVVLLLLLPARPPI